MVRLFKSSVKNKMKRCSIKVPSSSGWKEIVLSSNEVDELVLEAKADHTAIMADCVSTAKGILHGAGYIPTQHDIVRMAVALFMQESTHTHYYLEDCAKAKVVK